MPDPKPQVCPASVVTLAALAAILCWTAVSWAFRGDLFLYADEIVNLSGSVHQTYPQILHLFPQWIYNDRPVGTAFERLLYDLFGLHYTVQLACFLLVHFANCAMGFYLFRRLHVSTPLSIAAIALYGSLSTTAETATYIGAVFDVLCLFFLLAATLSLLSAPRKAAIASALFFLLALRSKEFAISAPLMWTVLSASRRIPWKRLYPHYLIAAIFLLRYSTFLPRMRREVPASDPYYLDIHLSTVVKSLAHYTGLIFAVPDFTSARPWLVAIAFAAIVIYALYRRRPALLFAVISYVLLLLPVSFLPNIRASFYVYAPQLFLLLALSLLLQDLLQSRRTLHVCAAVAILCLAAFFQRSDYFRNRVNFTLTVRQACKRTADNLATHLGPLPPGSHIYVIHGDSRPWLLASGNCAYLKLFPRFNNSRCWLAATPQALAAVWSSDRSPKIVLQYHDDGSLTVWRSLSDWAPPGPVDTFLVSTPVPH